MLQTCRAALKQLKRSTGFSFTVILILAIGIGVTTAMYSVLYAVILQPLPFPQPDRLVAISAGSSGFFSYPTLQDWQTRAHAFQSLAAYAGWSPRIESSAGVGHADAILISKNYLGTLGTGFALGQDFTQTGNEADCLDQAIVSDGYWRRMGGGSSLTGRTLQLDHRTYAVVLSSLHGIKSALPVGCSKERRQAFTPGLFDLSVASQHSSHAERKEIPEIHRPGGTQRFYRAPFDLHPVRVKEDNGTLLAPVTLLAPFAQDRVGVRLPEIAPLCQARKVSRDQSTEFTDASFGLLYKQVSVEWTAQP